MGYISEGRKRWRGAVQKPWLGDRGKASLVASPTAARLTAVRWRSGVTAFARSWTKVGGCQPWGVPRPSRSPQPSLCSLEGKEGAPSPENPSGEAGTLPQRRVLASASSACALLAGAIQKSCCNGELDGLCPP